jgi:hypothetical protein
MKSKTSSPFDKRGKRGSFFLLFSMSCLLLFFPDHPITQSTNYCSAAAWVGFLRFRLFCRGANKGAGAFELEPAREEECFQFDPDSSIIGFGLKSGGIKYLDTFNFAIQVFAAPRGSSRQNPGHITSRHVPGGRVFSASTHHGLEVKDDRDGAVAALPDVRSRRRL